MEGQVEGLVERLLKLADAEGVRLGVLGGASSLLVSEGGPRLLDVHETPAEILPEVLTGITKLEMLKDSPDTLDWFYLSPAASFGAWIPQHVTGDLPHQRRRSYSRTSTATPRSPGRTWRWPSSTRSRSHVTNAAASTLPTDVAAVPVWPR